jgi:hypothetical protein
MKSANPSDLLKLKKRFEAWRKTRAKRSKTPDHRDPSANGVGTSKNLCRRHSAEGSRLTGLISNIRETPISYYVGLRT